MPGCSADYCTNSLVKGFQVCRFPKDEKRRKIWIENVNRPDWIPGSSCTLCEEHFEEDMWEKTRNGKRRLKNTAVPTIFGHSGKKQEDTQNNAMLQEDEIPQMEVEEVTEGHKDSFAGSSDRNLLNRLHKLEKLYALATKSNYDNDDRGFLDEFLDVLLKNRSKNSHFTISTSSDDSLCEPTVAQENININRTELNVLYHIAGYIIQSIKKNQKICDNCINATKSRTVLYFNYNILTQFKANKKKHHFLVNINTFKFFIQMEKIFRMYYPN